MGSRGKLMLQLLKERAEKSQSFSNEGERQEEVLDTEIVDTINSIVSIDDKISGKVRDTSPPSFGVDTEAMRDDDPPYNAFSENGSSDEYIPNEDELSETDCSGESDSDVSVSRSEEVAVLHVTAENSQQKSPVVNAAPSEKIQKAKRKIFESREKISRKRTRIPEKWKKNKAAIARAKGESYLSQNGKIMPQKQIEQGTLCKEKCRLNCNDKFTLEARYAILKKYYSLDINAKNALLFKSIVIENVQRHRANTTNPKKFTFKYSITYDQKVIPVCRDALCGLFQFSRKKIENIQRKLKNGECAPTP
ncbi:uncharacterized protein LOC116159361 [Photinus pyralis]|uniref:uncharacterized protein LOC116159361 n=1 Tax=Photinus pyralis TaxID=7054 RepID=UPI0012671C8D|nr:uncharacterized protein LOC116159361 [Photinus pyralis]